MPDDASTHLDTLTHPADEYDDPAVAALVAEICALGDTR